MTQVYVGEKNLLITVILLYHRFSMEEISVCLYEEKLVHLEKPKSITTTSSAYEAVCTVEKIISIAAKLFENSE